MRIVYMGTPNFSVPVLEKLIENGYEIVLVVTQPDRLKGRKKELVFSPVKELAIKHNIKVHQPEKLKVDLNPILELNPDLIITAAYGQILPKTLLEKVKAINVHGSLLPKYRGGAPIQYSLFDGLKKTGITIMDMAYKMDSGDIILQEEVEILENDTYTSLSKKLSYVGADLLIKALKGDYKRIKQDENEVSFAYTLKREDEFLNFDEPADKVINHLRGLLDEPAASILINNEVYKVYKLRKDDIISDTNPGKIIIDNKRMFITTKTNLVEVLEIQAPGKKKMFIKDFLNGQKIIKTNDFVGGNKNE